MLHQRVDGPPDLEADLKALAEDGFCADIHALIADALQLLSPPEQISTTECAERYRYLPLDKGEGKRLWSKALTPYMVAPQDALDNPAVKTVIVVGPARSGKSVGGINHLFKRLRFGPLTDTLIYLPGDTDVNTFADTDFATLVDLHPEIRGKLGPTRTDNKRKFKRFAGRYVEILPANDRTVRMRQAPYIMATEIDAYSKRLIDGFKDLVSIRGRAYGNLAKAYLESHPDKGLSSGIASMWKESSQGVFYWPHLDPECGRWSTTNPRGEDGMLMRLFIDRPEGMTGTDLYDHVEQNAALICPHCGGEVEKLIYDVGDTKQRMLEAGVWIFEGQTITPEGEIIGTPKPNATQGFWIHGTMSRMVTWNELARDYAAALVFFEKTRKPDRLKEVTVKSLGEIYEGAGEGSRVLDADRLARRAREDNDHDEVADLVLPRGAKFWTAAVDVGGSKFDLLFTAWDLEGRSWLLHRDTLTRYAGRTIRPAERIDDWNLIRDEILRRRIPLADTPDMEMPCAGVAIDTGGVGRKLLGGGVEGVTWKAREFARRMIKSGDSGHKGYRLRLIKGAKGIDAEEIHRRRAISKDDQGKTVEPVVMEFDLGVSRLKTTALERLALEEDGPGYVRFARSLPRSVFSELAAEWKVDGKWERHGDNESLDLFGYNEAVRILLAPERREINWDRPPVWARPVPVIAAPEPAAAPQEQTKPKLSAAQRLAALNRR